MKVRLPKILHSKTFRKKLKIIAIAVFLVLFSAFFLLTGPKALDLIESEVSSDNIPNPQGSLGSEVLAASNTLEALDLVPTLVSKNIPAPYLSAVSVIAYDVNTDKVLYEKNAHTRLAPASTTKIMTAIVAVEHFNSGDLLLVPGEAIVGGSKMGLSAGEQITFRSLLYGMMLNSGNDAAFTIAMNYPGGYEAFINRMNEKVFELGLLDTNFDNPAGFDSLNHYSSSFDLLQIGKQVLKNARLGTVFSTKETSVTSIDKSQIHVLKNLNKLLNDEGVIGIKTGTTEKAGESLVGLVEKNGQTILTVMLNSQDRFAETRELIDWIFKNFTREMN